MLLDYQEHFKNAVLQNAPSEFMKNYAAAGSADYRLSIYRNNLFVSLIEVLKQAFPVIEKMVGTQNFMVLARVFIKENLPQKAQLSDYGEVFPNYLRALDHVIKDIPYIDELARLEWLRHKVYFAENSIAFTAEVAQQIAPEELFSLEVMLRPQVALLETHYPLLNLLDGAHEEPVNLSKADEFLLIYRTDYSEKIETESLSKDQFSFLKHIQSGMNLGEAFSYVVEEFPEFDLQQLLVQLLYKSILTAKEHN